MVADSDVMDIGGGVAMDFLFGGQLFEEAGRSLAAMSERRMRRW